MENKKKLRNEQMLLILKIQVDHGAINDAFVTRDIIPAQIGGTYHLSEFSHLQAPALLFDNQD